MRDEASARIPDAAVSRVDPISAVGIGYESLSVYEARSVPLASAANAIVADGTEVERVARELLQLRSEATPTKDFAARRSAPAGTQPSSADIDALLRFAGHALSDRIEGNIGDWDGGDMQEAMVRCGLLAVEQRQVPCAGECACADVVRSGETTDCLITTKLGNRAWREFDRASRAVAAAPKAQGQTVPPSPPTAEDHGITGNRCEVPEDVTRVELIDHREKPALVPGRAFVAYGVKVALQYQDDGRTLKVFVDDRAPTAEDHNG